jgi:hypothetical protein
LIAGSAGAELRTFLYLDVCLHFTY